MPDAIGLWLKNTGLDILIILLAGWLARRFGNLVIERVIRRLIRVTNFNALTESDVKKRQDTLIGLCQTVWRLLIVFAVALLVFEQLFPRINLTPIFASAGIIGIVVGFGAQSFIKDFLSGMFIILENQYRVGDVVDLEGAAGTVEKISVRSTTLRDTDGNVHYLPNGMIAHVINKTMGFSKVHFSISVTPETDVDKLSNVINRVGENLANDEKWQSKILDPPHFVNVGSFTRQALEVIISGKTVASAQWSVTGEMRKRLLKELHKHKIELARTPTVNPKN